MTTFSVIIPTYNRRDYLLECLASVAAQRFAPHEVIVIDDGSTDGTLEAVEGLQGVALIRQANAGPGAARNRGATAATGDYLAFLDSDDLWFPWSLDTMAMLVERYRPSLLFAQFENFTDDATLMAVEAPPSGAAYADFLSAAPDGCFAGAGMMVVDRARFLTAGGFAEDRLNAEDHDLALRLGTAPCFVQAIAPIMIAHRVHKSNEMGDIGKTLGGLARALARERNGAYPGGLARRRERCEILMRHVRPVILGAAQQGHLRSSFALYREAFSRNLRLMRLRFLVTAPLIMLVATLRSQVHRN